MVTCTAMASGILLANPSRNLPFPPQHPIQLRIHELIPLAQVFALATFVTHAELDKNPSRSGVVLEMRREDAVQLQVFKSVAQHLASCFGRVALSPIRHAQPVAEFGVLVLGIDAQPDAADLAAVTAQRGRQPELARLLCEGKKVPSILLGVGMCNAQSGGRNFPRPNQRQQFGDIGLGVRAQLQPRSFEGWRRDRGHSARASAMPASAPPRHSRLLLRTLVSISPHWPCSKYDMVSNA